MNGHQLRRYLVQWSDGVQRVIHGDCVTDARQLAFSLKCPTGVSVLAVMPLLPDGEPVDVAIGGDA